MTQEEKTDQEKRKTGVSRREFIAGTVGGVVVGAVVGAAAGSLGFPKTITQTQTQTQTLTQTTTAVTTAQPWLPAKWDQTADVVIVGYGGSGAVTAISAHDAGASVLVLEKSPSLVSIGATSATTTGTATVSAIQGGGGNTHLSMGNILVPTDANGIANFLFNSSWGTTPMDVCQAWANTAVNINTWLNNLGIKFTPSNTPLTGGFANIPGASAYARSTVVGGGAALFQTLDSAVQSRGIKVLLGTPATSLIQNGDTGEVIGVTANSGGSAINVKANKGVVLCCGSFEYDEAMKAQYLRGYPAHFESWMFNTGDGVKMAQKAGAGLWHMTTWSAALVGWFPDHGPVGFGISPKGNSWMYVDTSGNRFCNESDVSNYGDSYANDVTNFNMDAPMYQRIPTFLVFDESVRKAGAIGPTAATSIPTQLGGSDYVWSNDNSAEITKGWIIEGATSPADLANAINAATIASVPTGTVTGPSATMKFNINPAVLTATVNTFNNYATAKSDAAFGRPAASMAALTTPPYYAVPLWPGGPNNMGGPIRNAKGQVCDPYNNPIPRLYSGGECGSIWGFLYPGAGNLSEVISFGQISGQNAAAETSWS